MSQIRSIEDQIREQYIAIYPKLELARDHAQALVLNFLLQFRDSMSSYERLEVRHRIKDCESAIGTLRRKQEGATFDIERKDSYSLLKLHDLIGFRIMAFPKSLATRINADCERGFHGWQRDHEYLEDGEKLLFMYKYHGMLPEKDGIPIEVQIMPMLAGLFSDVEHDALYKPKEQYKGIAQSLEMRNLRAEVLHVLDRFETAFESFVISPTDGSS